MLITEEEWISGIEPKTFEKQILDFLRKNPIMLLLF
jgi:hypothetical protein